MVCVEKKNFGCYFVRGFFRNGDIGNKFYILGPMDCFKLVDKVEK